MVEKEEFWALRDVSFELTRGRALGIIGPNGAGKSTTLKLLTKILRPTRGRSVVHGRVGALIEIAAGFHPDLTGRENIILQGAVLGMKRVEILRKFDAIVDFAGVSEFIDTPVKRYSSGMNARLGFSIAAHLDPDALIIDEVLSVGDMTFQQKCYERMAAFKRNGTTIVFVSHNLQAVSMLCDEVLLLNRGVQAYGPTAEVLESYVNASVRRDTPSGGSEVDILSAAVVQPRDASRALVPGTPVALRVDFRANAAISDLTFGFLVHRSTDGLIVYDANIKDAELGIRSLESGHEFSCDFQFTTHLTRGLYHVECHVFHNPTQRFLSRWSPAATFTIEESRTYAGIADLELGVRLAKSNREMAESA